MPICHFVPKPLTGHEKKILYFLLAIAFLLRFGDTFWHPQAPDQNFSMELVAMPWGEMIQATFKDTHPPLYYLILKCWMIPFKGSLNWAQTLSALFSIATIAVTFRLSRDLFSKTAGWITLLFMTFAPYQIYWGHLARNHTFLPLAVVSAVWLSYAYLIAPSKTKWFMIFIAWAFAVQMNYMGLVAGAVWGIAFILFETATPIKTRFKLATAGLLGAMTLSYWFIAMKRQVAEGPMNHNFFQEEVSPIYLYYHSLFGSMVAYQINQSGVLYLLLLLIFALTAVFGAGAIGKRWSFWMMLLALPTLPIILAKTAKWTLAERHLLFTIPIFCAYWGAAAEHTWKSLQQRWRTKLNSTMTQ